MPRFALLVAAAAVVGCSTTPPAATLGVSGTTIADATHLPTGVALDPAGVTHPVGPMPLNIAVSPRGDRVALALNGWSRTGLQIVDWRSGRIVQTIDLPAVFLGLAFSPDGRWLVVSGGNTDQVYRFRWTGDTATLADSIALAPRASARKNGTRYPAQLAFSADGSQLYVAENLADSLAVVDLATKRVVQRVATGRYPYGVAVAPDGAVFVSAWGESFVGRFARDGARLAPGQWIDAGRHPSAMALSRDGSRLYVASASTDRVAIVDARSGQPLGVLRDPPPAGPDEGATPNALALSADGTKLFVAEADANAVAVFDLDAAGAGSLAGRIPTGWYPAAVATAGTSLLVANGKGAGTHADPDGPGPRESLQHQGSGKNGTLGQLRGSLSVIDVDKAATDLAALTRRVVRANNWDHLADTPRIPPFEHVVYIIRENRTYDQVLGDLSTADGDAGLVYFGRAITPNAHAIAERFGAFDRFFVNAEVSADGHNWTTAAYASDYVEKTVQPNYSSRGRTYDYEGTNRGVIPNDDVNAPANGYLWTLAAARGVSLRNYGEFVERERKTNRFVPTKRELVGATHPDYPGFDLDIEDQHRADVWLAELATFVQRGSMPALEIVRLPNDHTSGGAAGKPTPRAHVADNDLALGRMIAALSRTPFWKSTVVFVLEDDAQNGPDHVDSHRAPLLVISPYNRPGAYHRFVNTTDVLATIERILNLGALSHFDYYGRPLTDVWAATPDLRPFEFAVPATPLTERNPANTRSARDSRRLDLDEEDASDDDDFSRILWHVVKGENAPYPGARRVSATESWVRR